jgi:RHS repeat-associated protein
MVNNVQTPDKLPGGYTRQQYQYDNTYRLTGASGEHKGTKATGYTMTVAYDNLYNIVHKTMQGVEDHEYDQAYDYSGPAPHQVMQIGGNSCKYDLNGNQLLNGEVESFWDEENRLMAVLNKGVLSQYTYDGGGNRAVKSNGGIQGIWLNGAPAGAVKHNDNYTVYVSPYIECTRTGFVKHYFAENQRIVTKLGHGKFTNITFPTAAITAGNIDYGKRVAQIEQSRIDYYASLGVSPGPPTDKTYWARPENSGIAAPVYTDSTANMVPRGWPGNTTSPPTGPPVFVDPVPSNDSVKAGYGFQDPGHLVENSQFFYHPDQSGNTSFISNTLGEVSMHVAYSPLGETFAEDHTGSYTTSYLFNARERDAITGNYYYGPRYYEPESSQWLSVPDPLGENAHTNIAGYRRLESASTNKNYSPLRNSGSTVSTGSARNSDIVYVHVKVAEEEGPEKESPKQSPKATTPKNKQLQALHNKYKRGGRLQTRNALQSNANFFRNASPVNRKK